MRPTLRILLQMIFKNITDNNCRRNATPIYASIPFMIATSRKIWKNHIHKIQSYFKAIKSKRLLKNKDLYCYKLRHAKKQVKVHKNIYSKYFSPSLDSNSRQIRNTVL